MKPALKKILHTDSAGDKQAQASDPLKSVWVGASAGTGKTKVLIDRVLRLMLPRPRMGAKSATPPDKILCLTFTKTAAAEMSNRIYQRLSEWSVMDDAALRDKLRELVGEEPSKDIEEEARRLFARVLDAPGGLKIMTIHSFCQSVLKRFPVEAGLPPHFELMDEQNAVEHLTKCLHDIIAETKRQPQSGLAHSFSRLALILTPEEMSDLMSKIMSRRSLLGEILKHHGDAEGHAEKTIEKIYDALNIPFRDPVVPAKAGIHESGGTLDSRFRGNDRINEADVLNDVAEIHAEDEANLKKALNALLQGSSSDKEKAEFMQPWLEQKHRRTELFFSYKKAFFTQKGEIAKKLGTQAAQKIYPDLVSVMQREAERLEVLQKRLQAVKFAELNKALLTVASEMVGRYAAYKRERASLDFDDLIIRTCELLSGTDMVQWVLFKLDQGIDHILVDEAQDTSPQQWRVIKELADEFFAGTGAKDDVVRTLFVVGDEKQSIFSFQGADPYEFARMHDYFGARAKSVQDEWKVRLDYSFRSTRTVLEVVDTVFNDAEAKRGVVFDAQEEVLHLPFREGHAGLVELWPLVTSEKRAEGEPWQLPTEIEQGDSASGTLARKIAVTIRGWIDNKEMLPSRGRPIRAGDVLILVQTRGAFVELIMRALKEQGVDVAGIDRMTLTEEIAVMDLLAAADFALLPKDDLTLATLLKSPLIGLNEEELFDLCHGRKGSLWGAVRDKQPEIARWLEPLIKKSGYATPYEFFAHILNTPCFADKVSGKRALFSRLGLEIEDAVSEFLNSCLHYEQTHTASLQKFIDWFLKGKTEIKREQEAARTDQVRIMTVHGSKGLQAPIVFLPDTVKKLHDHNKGRVRLIWPADEQGVPLWSPRSEFDADEYDALRQAAAEKQEEEYRRLLYVALTRAEDRLYIAGYHGVRDPKDDCWYRHVERCFPADAEKIEQISADGEVTTLRRSHHPQEAPLKPASETPQKKIYDREVLPLWAGLPPASEPSPSVPLAPSKPGEDEPAAKGPLASDTGWKFRRGVIAHQILEILPQLPEEKREKALTLWLARPQLKMKPDEQKEFAAEILAVLRHPDFAPIFGTGSAAEVPVVGMTGENKKQVQVLSGQMDRVLVAESEILIVDYKTNRPPPKDETGVATVYLKQMASYISVMKKIYPEKTVKCALLWTDGPHLMPLSEKLLDPYVP